MHTRTGGQRRTVAPATTPPPRTPTRIPVHAAALKEKGGHLAPLLVGPKRRAGHQEHNLIPAVLTGSDA